MKSIRAPAVFTGALMLWYTSSDLLGFLVEIPRAGFHGLAYAGYFFYPKIPPLPKTTLTNGWYGGGAMAGMGGGNGWYGPLPAVTPELIT